MRSAFLVSLRVVVVLRHSDIQQEKDISATGWGDLHEFLEIGDCPSSQESDIFPRYQPTWRFMVISRGTIVITHIRGLITPLTTTHEPPRTILPSQSQTHCYQVLWTLRDMGIGPVRAKWPGCAHLSHVLACAATSAQ